MSEKKKRGCLAKLLLASVILAVLAVVLYALAGFVAVPTIGRTFAEKKATEALGRPVTLDKLALNPFTLRLQADDFAIAGDSAEAPYVSAGSLVADISFLDCLKSKFKAYTVTELTLTEPSADIVFDADGNLNLAQLGRKKDGAITDKTDDEEKTGQGGLPDITIQSLTISGGTVSFQDDRWPRPFKKLISPINLTIVDFRTQRDDNGLIFSAVGKTGEQIDLDATFDLEPFSTEGTIKLSNLPPRSYAPIFEKFVNLDIIEGLLALETAFSVKPSPNGEGMAIGTSAGNFTIDGLSARQGEAEPFARIPELRISGVSTDLAAATVQIASITSTATFLDILKSADGVINVTNLGVAYEGTPPGETVPALAAAPEPSADTASTKWQISLDQLAFTGTEVRYTEAGSSPLPVTFDLTGQSLNTAGSDGQIGLKAQLPDAGTIDIDSSLNLGTGVGNGTIKLGGLGLGLAKPWFDGIGKVKLNAEDAGFDGTIAFLELLNPGRSFDIKGKVALGPCSCIEEGKSEPMVSWKTISIGEVSYFFPANDYKISGIDLGGLVVNVVREADGQINIPRAFAGDGPKEDKPKSEPNEAAGLFGIDRFGADVVVNFRDEAISPNYKLTAPLDIKITDMTVGRKNRLDFDITGSLDHFAPIEAKGTYDDSVSKIYPEIVFLMKNLYLPQLSPYTAKYIGRNLNGGAVSLKKVIEIPSLLNGEMKFFFDQLKVSEKVPAEDAIDAPLGLALFILSRKGKVDQEILVSGDPNDPNFNYTGVIWKSLLNVSTKLIAAPLEMVADAGGALFKAATLGVGNKEQTFQSLSFSGSSLTAEAKATLDTLAVELKAEPYIDLRLALPAASGPDANTVAVGQRVSAARNYLMSKHGFRPHRVLGMRPGDFKHETKDGAPEIGTDGTAFHAWLERLDK